MKHPTGAPFDIFFGERRLIVCLPLPDGFVLFVQGGDMRDFTVVPDIFLYPLLYLGFLHTLPRILHQQGCGELEAGVLYWLAYHKKVWNMHHPFRSRWVELKYLLRLNT